MIGKKNAVRLVIIASVRLRKSAVCFSACANFSSVTKFGVSRKLNERPDVGSVLLFDVSFQIIFLRQTSKRFILSTPLLLHQKAVT